MESEDGKVPDDSLPIREEYYDAPGIYTGEDDEFPTNEGSLGIGIGSEQSSETGLPPLSVFDSGLPQFVFTELAYCLHIIANYFVQACIIIGASDKLFLECLELLLDIIEETIKIHLRICSGPNLNESNLVQNECKMTVDGILDLTNLVKRNVENVDMNPESFLLLAGRFEEIRVVLNEGFYNLQETNTALKNVCNDIEDEEESTFEFINIMRNVLLNGLDFENFQEHEILDTCDSIAEKLENLCSRRKESLAKDSIPDVTG